MRTASSRRSESKVESSVASRNVPRKSAKHQHFSAREMERVFIAANEFALRIYAIGYTSGTPRRLTLGDTVLWIVPIIFTSPGYGSVGEVGVLAVDASSHTVIGFTPREEVLAAGARLAKENRDALDAAFRRARSVG
jgi:hypothetical protein